MLATVVLGGYEFDEWVLVVGALALCAIVGVYYTLVRKKSDEVPPPPAPGSPFQQP